MSHITYGSNSYNAHTTRTSNLPPPYRPRSDTASDYGSGGIRFCSRSAVQRAAETDPLYSSAVNSRPILVQSPGISPWALLFSLILASIAFVLGRNQGYTNGVNSFYNPKLREAIRIEWENEKKIMADTRAQWAREREEYDEWQRRSRQEREREEEKKRKEEERQRANIRWDEPRPLDQCHSYGTREYTAQLLNVPRTMDAMGICLETPVVIHGRTLPSPNHCEDRGKWGGVFGHWMVDFDESACQPYWEWFKDKGCIGQGSGLRRYESHLENLRSSNWPEMCSTTPAYINNQYFESPTHCVDWGKYGIWGIWEVSDHNC